MISLTLFAIILVFIIAIHASYPLVLKSLQRYKTSRFRPHIEGYNLGLPVRRRESPELPVVSVIIPVHNEELVIERRLNNILRNGYPQNKMQIVVVDSGSVDKTSSIELEKFQDEVMLLREEYRQGKAHAQLYFRQMYR